MVEREEATMKKQAEAAQAAAGNNTDSARGSNQPAVASRVPTAEMTIGDYY